MPRPSELALGTAGPDGGGGSLPWDVAAAYAKALPEAL